MNSVSQWADLTSDDRQELQLLYTSCAADIALFTRQQWWAGAYALAIDALLLAGGYQFGEAGHGGWQAWVLVLVTWMVCLYGVVAVKRMQNSIVVGRRRLERTRMHFGRAFQEVWAMPRPSEDIHRLLYYVMGFGAVLVSWLALDRAYVLTLPMAP